MYEFVDGVTVDSFAGFNGLDPNGTWELLIADISAGDVGSVTGGFSLAFTTDATGAVPEPASWAAMIAGFGLIGGAMRRRAASRATA